MQKPAIIAACIANQNSGVFTSAVPPKAGAEDEELDDRHHPVHPDLPRADRGDVGLHRLPDALADRQVAHRLDGEILEHDADQEGDQEVGDPDREVLSANRLP